MLRVASFMVDAKNFPGFITRRLFVRSIFETTNISQGTPDNRKTDITIGLFKINYDLNINVTCTFYFDRWSIIWSAFAAINTERVTFARLFYWVVLSIEFN